MQIWCILISMYINWFKCWQVNNIVWLNNLLCSFKTGCPAVDICQLSKPSLAYKAILIWLNNHTLSFSYILFSFRYNNYHLFTKMISAMLNGTDIKKLIEYAIAKDNNDLFANFFYLILTDTLLSMVLLMSLFCSFLCSQWVLGATVAVAEVDWHLRANHTWLEKIKLWCRKTAIPTHG